MLGVLGIFKARGTKVFNEWIGKTSQIAGGSLTSMLAIKCILGTQVYGPFLLNMALPFIIAILLFIVIIPTTFFRRLCEKRWRHERVIIDLHEEIFVRMQVLVNVQQGEQFLSRPSLSHCWF